MYETKYYVDKEKGVVVCKIMNVQCALHNEMEKKDLGFNPASVCMFLSDMSDVFVGKAKCSGGDTFNEELGRKIAYKRAVVKMNAAKKKTMKRLLKLFKEHAEKTIDAIEYMIHRYGGAELNAKGSLEAMMDEINK